MSPCRAGAVRPLSPALEPGSFFVCGNSHCASPRTGSSYVQTCGDFAMITSRHATAVLIASFAALGPAYGEPHVSPCTEDAIIVFDASGSMAGNL